MRHRFGRATPYYALIQGFYWGIFCLMLGFASVFLLDKGFTNSQIGLVLGLSYLLSAILQPVIGSVFSRKGVRLNMAIACVYMPVALIAACVQLVPMGRLPLAALMIVSFTLQSTLQPSVNALSQSFETPEDRVNFGLARGVGSAAYALASFAMGRLLLRFAPSVLPTVYGLAVAAMIVALIFAPVNGSVSRGSVEKGASYGEILRAHPHLALFMVGICSLFLTYAFIDSFLVQIIISIGGTSANLGTAITLSAMTELPAMMLFARLSRRGSGIRVFLISIWFWMAKDVLTLLAPSPGVLYAVQLLNFFSCAVYVPGMMDYMRHTLPESQLLRGATLAGTSTTLGSLLATIIGGWLMDAIGVRSALAVVQIFAVFGAILLTFALRRAIRESDTRRA